MTSRTFLQIEDREGKASYVFWNSLLEQLCPDIEVESKKNSSELVKAVKNLEDTDNKYVIVFDNSFDNLQVVMEKKHLKKVADEKKNVVLIDCWIKSCCEWNGRMKDDVCGLDYSRLTIYDKMKSIYEGTCLKGQFHATGLEVAL